MSIANIRSVPEVTDAMSYTVEIVGPETAAAWLASSAGNRRLRLRHIRNLASEMTAGQWHPHGGSAVKFDRNGRLVDGHHRLSAVISCGRAVQMHVLRGADENAQNYEVAGIGWTNADILERKGIKYSSLVASAGKVITTLLAIESGRFQSMQSGNNLTPAEIRSTLSGCADLEHFVKEVFPYGKNRFPISVSELSGFVFFAHTNPSTINPKASEFIRLLTFGENIGTGHPAFALRGRMLDSNLRGTLRQHSRFVLLAKSWNAFLEFRQILQLKATADESIPKVVKV